MELMALAAVVSLVAVLGMWWFFSRESKKE